MQFNSVHRWKYVGVTSCLHFQLTVAAAGESEKSVLLQTSRHKRPVFQGPSNMAAMLWSRDDV